MAQRLEDGANADVIGGTAGTLAVFLAVQRFTEDDVLYEPARLLGRSLCRRAITQPEGCYWPTGMAAEGLAGFAHGISGIVHALARLTTLDCDQTHLAVIRGGLAYERALFVESAHNWRDLRKHNQRGATFGFGWCHGAPGIGIARATLPPPLFGSPERIDLLNAVDAVLRRSGTEHDCMCHGDLGNLETLILASERLADPALLAIARRRGLALVRARRDAGDWRCGISAAAPTPGLLVGLAGIGYELLRLWNPGKIPSILSLDAPHRAGTREESPRLH